MTAEEKAAALKSRMEIVVIWNRMDRLEPLAKSGDRAAQRLMSGLAVDIQLLCEAAAERFPTSDFRFNDMTEHYRETAQMWFEFSRLPEESK